MPQQPAKPTERLPVQSDATSVLRAAERAAIDEAVRRQLAAELHDGLGAELVAAHFALASLAPWLSDAEPACRERFDTARRALEAAARECRRLISERAAPRFGDDLGTTLGAWIEGYSERTGLPVGFVCTPEAARAPVPDALALTVLRVTQEALSNVARHAQAHTAEVRLTSDADGLTVRISDDGVGVAANPGRGYGVDGMFSRCAALGGTLQVAPRADGAPGTAVTAHFAWRALTAHASPAHS